MHRTQAGHDDANRAFALVQVSVGAVTTGADLVTLGHPAPSSSIPNN